MHRCDKLFNLYLHVCEISNVVCAGTRVLVQHSCTRTTVHLIGFPS